MNLNIYLHKISPRSVPYKTFRVQSGRAHLCGLIPGQFPLQSLSSNHLKLFQLSSLWCSLLPEIFIRSCLYLPNSCQVCMKGHLLQEALLSFLLLQTKLGSVLLMIFRMTFPSACKDLGRLHSVLTSQKRNRMKNHQLFLNL